VEREKKNFVRNLESGARTDLFTLVARFGTFCTWNEMNANHLAGFRKAHTRAFCYSIRDMSYRQMRAYALFTESSLHWNWQTGSRNPSAQKVQVK